MQKDAKTNLDAAEPICHQSRSGATSQPARIRQQSHGRREPQRGAPECEPQDPRDRGLAIHQGEPIPSHSTRRCYAFLPCVVSASEKIHTEFLRLFYMNYRPPSDRRLVCESAGEGARLQESPVNRSEVPKSAVKGAHFHYNDDPKLLAQRVLPLPVGANGLTCVRVPHG
jgi:hypothetical protein